MRWIRWNVGATCEGKRYSTSASVFCNGATAEETAASCAVTVATDSELSAQALATATANFVNRFIMVYPCYGGKSLYLYTDKHNDDKRPYQSKGLVTKPEIVTIGVRRIICGAYRTTINVLTYRLKLIASQLKLHFLYPFN